MFKSSAVSLWIGCLSSTNYLSIHNFTECVGMLTHQIPLKLHNEACLNECITRMVDLLESLCIASLVLIFFFIPTLREAKSLHKFGHVTKYSLFVLYKEYLYINPKRLGISTPPLSQILTSFCLVRIRFHPCECYTMRFCWQ